MTTNLATLVIHTERESIFVDLNSCECVHTTYLGDLVGGFDFKTDKFFKMDICSYSWLQFFPIHGFKSRDLSVKTKKMPEKVILLDGIKAEFSAEIKEMTKSLKRNPDASILKAIVQNETFESQPHFIQDGDQAEEKESAIKDLHSKTK